MKISEKDKVAVFVSIIVGGAFGALTASADIVGFIFAAPFIVIVVPCIMIFLADQRLFLVWQVSALSFILGTILAGWQVPGSPGGASVLLVVWAGISLLTCPVPIFLYRRHRIRSSER